MMNLEDLKIKHTPADTTLLGKDVDGASCQESWSYVLESSISHGN